MAMTQTYRFTDPTTNNTIFECYSTDYINQLEATIATNLSMAITNLNTTLTQYVDNEVSTINTTISTLNTNLTQSINDVRTDLTQYVDTEINTVTTVVNALTTIVNDIQDGTGDIYVTNIDASTVNTETINAEVINIKDGDFNLDNSNIVFTNVAGDIMNVGHIVFESSTGWKLDLGGGTIINSGLPVNDGDLASKKYVDDAIAAGGGGGGGSYLPLNGGTMNGAINMNSNNITALHGLSFINSYDSSVLPLITSGTYGGQQYGINFGTQVYPSGGPQVGLTGVTVIGPTNPAVGTVATTDWVNSYYVPRNSNSTINANMTLGMNNTLNWGSLSTSINGANNVFTVNSSYGTINMRAAPGTNDIVNVSYVTQQFSQYIPSSWSTTNSLVTSDDVTNLIQSVSSRQLSANATGSPFATAAALVAGPYYYRGVTTTPVEHDTAVVLSDETATGIYANGQTLHKYDGTTWAYLYGINETPFTPAQNAAINSGVTSSIVSNISGGPFLPLSGGTMTGSLTAQNITLQSFTAQTNSLVGANLSVDGNLTVDEQVRIGNGLYMNGTDIMNPGVIRNLQRINNGPGTIYVDSQMNFSNYPLQSVGDPVNAQDAATKAYVDGKANGSIAVGIEQATGRFYAGKPTYVYAQEGVITAAANSEATINIVGPSSVSTVITSGGQWNVGNNSFLPNPIGTDTRYSFVYVTASNTLSFVSKSSVARAGSPSFTGGYSIWVEYTKN